MSWIRHAFAINASSGDPTREQLDVVERLCQEVVRRRLTSAAIAFLEMTRPLNYLGAQALHYFAPMISAIASGRDHEHLASFLERRDAIDRICSRLEAMEAAKHARGAESAANAKSGEARP